MAAVTASISEPADLAGHAVKRLRLSPHTADMFMVARTYRELLDGVETPTGARFVLSSLDLPGAIVDGYLRDAPGCQAPAAM